MYIFEEAASDGNIEYEGGTEDFPHEIWAYRGGPSMANESTLSAGQLEAQAFGPKLEEEDNST